MPYRYARADSILLSQVDQADNQVTYLEASDENQCNWMMFVRPATSYAEQNLVAFQRGPGIYFSTIKAIEARQELKVFVNDPRGLHSTRSSAWRILMSSG